MSAETIEACPECDSSRVSSTNANPMGAPPSAAYYCNDCSATFEEPIERERGENNGVINSPHARALIATDPAEVPGDD